MRKEVVKMLAIKDKIMLWKFKKLVNKRNKEFAKGNFNEATEYGKLVDHYITDVLKLEDGLLK